MPGRRSVYAWVHTACGHPATQHRLVDGAPVEGPYACRLCPCQMMQRDPVHGITEAEFRQLFCTDGGAR
jgi:hypothetical protein